MARRQANPVFQQHAHQNTDTNVMFAKTSQSLGVVLRRARASGFLELSDRRLRALPVEAYAPTPEDLDPDEKFWEIVELRSLDATGNLFDELPGDWRSVGTLRQLRVGKNRLCALPEGIFADLPNLEVLDCGDNQIRHLPGFQGCGASLKTLLAPRNRLQALDAGVLGLAALEALDVGGNVDLKCLPRLPERLQKVDAENCGLTVVDRLPEEARTLCLSKNRLSEGVDVRHCRWLTYLDLRSNGMATYAIPDLPNLSHVFLGHNGLGDVALERPSDALAHVDLGANRLRHLPPALGACGGLQSIDASNNDLGEVPAALGYLPKLHRLSLEGNPLRTLRRDLLTQGCDRLKAYLRTRGPSLLPEEAELARPSSSGDDRLDARSLANGVRDPESRGVLDLKGRKLERCPLSRDDARTIRDDLAADDGLDEYVADPRKRALVAKVQVVDASNNDLAQPPEAAVLLELGPALSELKLCRNKLSALPLAALARVPLKRLDCRENAIDRDEFLDAVSPLGAHLTELDASSNRLRAVPRSVFACVALRSLRLPRNAIAGDLQRGWGALVSLETLDVADNRLTSLGDVHAAPRLRVLDLANNSIRNVPPELGLCPELRTLVLHGNPQRSVRAADLPRDTPKVLAKLRDRLPANVGDRAPSPLEPSGRGRRGQPKDPLGPEASPRWRDAYDTRSPRLHEGHSPRALVDDRPPGSPPAQRSRPGSSDVVEHPRHQRVARLKCPVGEPDTPPPPLDSPPPPLDSPPPPLDSPPPPPGSSFGSRLRGLVPNRDMAWSPDFGDARVAPAVLKYGSPRGRDLNAPPSPLDLGGGARGDVVVGAWEGEADDETQPVLGRPVNISTAKREFRDRAMAWSPDPRDKAQRPPRRNLDLGPSAPFAKPIPRVSPRLGGSDHNLGLGDPSPNAARRLRKPVPKPRAARDAADQEALLVLQSKVNDLNSMLRHQDGALSQAKRFALKKQLARANADKIRFERELASR